MPNRHSISDFEYDCPRDAIAQWPLPDRSDSRLLVLNRATGAVEHRSFRAFPSLPDPGDVLVVNASRVIPARLKGLRDNGREAEVLLVHPEQDGTWSAMVHPGGKLKVGRTIRFGSDAQAKIVAVAQGGLRRVRFSGGLTPEQVIERYGSIPLPPYIDRPAGPTDAVRYQTIFAREDGSIAAPTAGLHFTAELLAQLRARGIQTVEIVLHVGPGTFKPVETRDIARHTMHAEQYVVSSAAATTINHAKERGHRIWAVGTTSARVLETAGNDGVVRPESGWTDLFIYPPFSFQIVDALLTNFHLPRSTLLMLVSAFGGYEHTMNAYREAVASRYRLYSYGDAMVVV